MIGAGFLHHKLTRVKQLGNTSTVLVCNSKSEPSVWETKVADQPHSPKGKTTRNLLRDSYPAAGPYRSASDTLRVIIVVLVHCSRPRPYRSANDMLRVVIIVLVHCSRPRP
jgi:hypothetical protein